MDQGLPTKCTGSTCSLQRSLLVSSYNAYIAAQRHAYIPNKRVRLSHLLPKLCRVATAEENGSNNVPEILEHIQNGIDSNRQNATLLAEAIDCNSRQV